MLRQLSGGSSRYRGLNPKDALHISLILAVTVWILYHLTYTYQNNLIIEYMQFKVHQEYKIAKDVSRNPTTATTDTGKATTHFEKVEGKRVDAVHEERGNSGDNLKKDLIKKEEERQKEIEEHQAREKSFNDDDVSSAVLSDNQMPVIKEDPVSGIATYSRNQNMTNDDNELNFILSNGTVVEKKNITLLGNFSDKSDRIKDVGKNENVLLVNLNETNRVEGLVQDAIVEDNRE